MKSVAIHPDSNIEIVDLPVPEPSQDGVLVKTIGCGVCGTDLLKINLRLLKKTTVLGHEYVGTIVKAGPDVQDFRVGDVIVAAHHVPCFQCHYCLHDNPSMCETFKKTNFEPGGFAEYVHLSSHHLAHATFKVPPDLPWEEAIFTEPLACCVRNVNQLNLLKGDVVIVVGLGSIGLMMSALLNRNGITVVGVDLDSKRVEYASNFGVKEAFTATDDKFYSKIHSLTDNRGADGVIFTAGPATMLAKSLMWVRDGGFVNLFSHLSGEKSEIDTSEIYHRELKLISTYSSSPNSLKEAFEILQQDTLKLRRLFASPYSPDNFAQAIKDVNARDVLKALIVF
jgi:L-iditol 2-dehydrogenase